MVQPAWAVALKAVSLAFAVVAYLILLLTMVSKHDPVKGFIVTVLCWCSSAATLLAVIGVIAREYAEVNPQQTLRYTQNYFYGTFAAGLYILVAVLLAIHTCSVRSVHLTHDERRTVECTSIILRVGAFSVFLLAGAAVYATIEGWTFMDALYWADYTLLTIGIGNIAPKTHLGRSLLFPYVSAGILNTGLVITSITSFTENIRELSIRFKMEEVHSGIQGRRPVDKCSSNSHSDREKQARETPAGSPYPNKDDLIKLQRIKRDFYRRHRWMTLIFSGVALFFLWLVSAAIFRRSERSQKWTYFQALYFTYISLTTIGYGDLYPTSNFGKTFFVFWSLLAVPVLTNLIAAMGQLGFEKLTYLLRYLWRLTSPRLGRMNLDSQRGGTRNKSVQGPNLVIASNSHSPNLTNAGQLSNNIPGSSAYEKNGGGASLIQAAQRSLLLGVEIGKLISTLQGSATTQIDLGMELVGNRDLITSGITYFDRGQTTQSGNVYGADICHILDRSGIDTDKGQHRRTAEKASSRDRSLPKYDTGALQQAGLSGGVTKSALFPAADYLYNFEFLLHNSLPETIDTELISTRYYLEAQIEPSGLFASKVLCQVDVPVIRLPAENSLELTEPIMFARKWHEQLAYDVCIFGKCFPLGSQIPIRVKLTPLVKLQCHRLRVYVSEHVQHYAKGQIARFLQLPTKKVLLFEKQPGLASYTSYPGSTMRIMTDEGTGTPPGIQSMSLLGEEFKTSEINLEVQLPRCREMKTKGKHQWIHFSTKGGSSEIVLCLSIKDQDGGGGFVPGIVFNPSAKGLAYARTDIGGAYRLNSDDTWTPLQDSVGNSNWHDWGVDALATDPIDTSRLYLAVGMYTNEWDPNAGSIMRSTDQGNTWSETKLPFKVGGNMPGRGMGERLAVDPNKNSILYYGARSGHGLWRSTDYGVTWSNVTSFIWTGTYFQDASSTYTSDPVGIAWVTFDSTSGSKGSPTPRIFVGVADIGKSVFVSEDAGSTWSWVTGEPQYGFLPHKGVLSPAEKTLYISYSNGAGPYDGTNGTVHKYNITSKVWTDISPTPMASTYYGYGGLSVDLQVPGTLMVAALNCWWPDELIFRSVDSGATWSPIWAWNGYPNLDYYYSYDISNAPWLQDDTSTNQFPVRVGWMVEALAIDPFDSNHWLYGTGATIYGGHDLEKWDTVHNVTLKSLAVGIEEMAVLGLISPPGGPPLLSAVGDVGGFYHADLDKAPAQSFHNPTYGTTNGIDYAGNKPSNLVRSGASDTLPTIAMSTDFGKTWSANYAASSTTPTGQVALSADADTVLLMNSNGAMVSKYSSTFSAVSSLPSGAAIASDKSNNTVFYGGSAGSFYVSTDGATSFTKTASLGSSTAVNAIRAHPSIAGDVWATTDTGLWHSTDYGKTFTKVGGGCTAGWSFGLGKASSTSSYAVIYGFFTIDGTTALFKTEDMGTNWQMISDSSHGFGAASANVVNGDMSNYGPEWKSPVSNSYRDYNKDDLDKHQDVWYHDFSDNADHNQQDIYYNHQYVQNYDIVNCYRD
ncbi:hypothetical protein KXW30_007370 [Aspergillus fumigatus]|nr:hypothetical protein KXV69_006934 [Aspergillus fumigatus]KAH2350198.1 hypothetical protein KXW30_007370 [Aspergillus fumigatus]KAH3399812.1 hypothetical protein KXW79_006502 [Aspergillus fumigatus]